MDLIQLYSATRRVVTSLKTSGLMPALKNYRASLRGQAQSDRASVEVVLQQASNAYIEKTALYGDEETAVVNLLHLAELGKSSYWLEMTSEVQSVERRMAQSVAAFSKVMFATSHLPGLLSLVREASAVDGLRSDEHDSGALILRLYDAIEPASNTERVSRLMDAVNMIYSACGSISDATTEPLRLMSITGVAVRSVIFHGDAQVIGSVRNVVAYLNEAAVRSQQDENYSLDAIAAEMPLLSAIDELEHLGRLSPDVAASSGRDVQEGAMMLLETGAQLVDFDAAADSDYLPTSVIARLDADSKSFDNIDSRIDESIEARYDEVYEHEKERLLNEPVGQAAKRPATVGAAAALTSSRGERSPSRPMLASKTADIRKDSIDELIIDLNRLYGEQR